MMKDNPYLTFISERTYKGFTYSIYENEYGFFAEAYDEEFPIRVRGRQSLEEACKWMEHAIDRWIDKGRNEHLDSIQAKNERMLFRTR